MDKKTDVRDPDEKVVEIEMERLRAFPNHPFKVIGDSQMIELQDSIKKYGVLNPLIVRPKIEGYYEIISGVLIAQSIGNITDRFIRICQPLFCSIHCFCQYIFLYQAPPEEKAPS